MPKVAVCRGMTVPKDGKSRFVSFFKIRTSSILPNFATNFDGNNFHSKVAFAFAAKVWVLAKRDKNFFAESSSNYLKRGVDCFVYCEFVGWHSK